jgi:hypothetical protein
VIAAAGRAATTADGVGTRAAEAFAGRCFAAVERNSDHLADELPVTRNSATAGFRRDARWAFEGVVVDTQRGFPRH